MADFGEYASEVSAMVRIVSPLISISLDAFAKLKDDVVQLKGDGSMVTICAFALQSLIMSGIQRAFPGDKVLGEEDLGKLSPDFLRLVSTLLPAGFDPIAACKDAIRQIPPEVRRVWVIDPVDGTQGFVQQATSRSRLRFSSISRSPCRSLLGLAIRRSSRESRSTAPRSSSPRAGRARGRSVSPAIGDRFRRVRRL
jgi:hypothetical protein